LDNPAEMDRVFAVGAERAEAVAAETLRVALDRVGLLPPRKG
jgi:tryptophanyl-tRNA synthetase